MQIIPGGAREHGEWLPNAGSTEGVANRDWVGEQACDRCYSSTKTHFVRYDLQAAPRVIIFYELCIYFTGLSFALYVFSFSFDSLVNCTIVSMVLFTVKGWHIFFSFLSLDLCFDPSWLWWLERWMFTSSSTSECEKIPISDQSPRWRFIASQGMKLKEKKMGIFISINVRSNMVLH